MKILMLLVLFVLLQMPAFAQNGGGGIRFNGKVYTFAEAGLKIADPETPYFPEPELIAATQSVLKKLNEILPSGARRLWPGAVFGNDHTYQRVQVEVPYLFERFKEEYSSYMRSLQPGEGAFVLAAYTESDRTYLFPDFFLASLDSQAIYLMHEAAYFLEPKAELEQVLRWEIALVDFLKNPRESERRVALFEAMAGMNLFGATKERSDHVFLALYVAELQGRGLDIDLSYFLAPDQRLKTFRCGNLRWDLAERAGINWHLFPTDALVLRDNREVDANFFRLFYRKSLYLRALKVSDYYEAGCETKERPENYRLEMRENEAGLPTLFVVAKNADLSKPGTPDTEREASFTRDFVREEWERTQASNKKPYVYPLPRLDR